MPLDINALEDAFSRQRSIRQYDLSRPVDDATIERLLKAATQAPNGGNRQLWSFLVIRDAGIKKQLEEVYEEEATRYLGGRTVGTTRWGDVPVLVAVMAPREGGGPSIYPAVQNLLLAASVMGLGGVLTTLWKAQEPRVKSILNVPAEVEIHAILPLGWPDRKYGRNKRKPVAEVTYRDTYGKAW